MIAGLAFGVPLVLLSMGADQPLSADRCQALGVARVLDVVTASNPPPCPCRTGEYGDPGGVSLASRSGGARRYL